MVSLQTEIFNSSIDLRQRYNEDPELKELLENVLDDKSNLYELARPKIIFNERSRKKVVEYMRKNLTATFSQNNIVIFEPVVTSFATYWHEVNYHVDLQNTSNPKLLKIDKNQVIEFKTQLDFITIMLDRVRLYEFKQTSPTQ